MSEPDEGDLRKKGGRPRKAPEKGRRQNYAFRMSDATRDAVQASADANGRSLSEEIERRIEFTVGIKEKCEIVSRGFDLAIKFHLQLQNTAVRDPSLLAFCSVITAAFMGAVEKMPDEISGGKPWNHTEEGRQYITEKMRKAIGDAVIFQAQLIDSGVPLFPDITQPIVTAEDFMRTVLEDL